MGSFGHADSEPRHLGLVGEPAHLGVVLHRRRHCRSVGRGKILLAKVWFCGDLQGLAGIPRQRGAQFCPGFANCLLSLANTFGCELERFGTLSTGELSL